MTTKAPPEGSRSELLLRNARQTYADISESVSRALSRLDSGEDKDLRAFSSAVQTHWKLLLILQEREAEIEKRNRELTGAAGPGAFDLDLARAEVGRRLARLRAARGD